MADYVVIVAVDGDVFPVSGVWSAESAEDAVFCAQDYAECCGASLEGDWHAVEASEWADRQRGLDLLARAMEEVKE